MTVYSNLSMQTGSAVYLSLEKPGILIEKRDGQVVLHLELLEKELKEIRKLF